MSLPVRFLLPSLPACGLMLGLAAGAAAQTPPAPLRLDEFPVNATPLDTAGATTVSTVSLARDPLPDLTLATVAAESANFFIADNRTRSFNDVFAFRGLTNTPIFGDPSVTVYLDDLPLGSGYTFPSDLAGIARAELHRGPLQNTEFGRAGSAGVLTLHTPEPAAAPTASLTLTAGDYRQREAVLTAATAGGATADAYVAVAAASRDGYLQNTTRGVTVDDQDSRSALARLRVRPTNASEVTLLLTASRARDGAQPLVPLSGGPVLTVARAKDGQTDLDSHAAALTTAVATAAGRLSATTGMNDWNLSPATTFLSFGPMLLGNTVSQHQRTWTEEVKLTSPVHAATTWELGAFVLGGRTTGAYSRTFGPYAYEASSFHLIQHTSALRGEASWHLAPTLALTAGLRLETSAKSLGRDETVPAVLSFGGKQQSSAWLPKLALQWQAAPDTLATVSAGGGFKPGGYSAFTGNAALAAFGPERSRALEAAVTQSLPASHLAFTARSFAYWITGYQIERSFATGATADDYLVVNAPRARSVGAEFEGAWKPLAGLSVTATGGWTRAELLEFTDPYTHVSYAGKRPPSVPEFTASLQADYETATGWFIGAGLTATGRVFYTEDEDPATSQGGGTLLAARCGYRQAHWSVTVYGANLADRRYFSAITPGVGHGTPGAPRTLGVQLTGAY